MSVVARTAGVAMLGFAVVACGGGAGGDEGAIKNVFRDFFRAFEDGDEARLAELLTDECDDADDIAEKAVRSYLGRGLEDVEYDVTGATIRDLTEDSAEALPEGTIRYEGGDSPLAEAGDEYARLVKIDGDWKFADCNILFGS